MNRGQLNPIMGLLLLLAGGIAVALIASAATRNTSTGQAPPPQSTSQATAPQTTPATSATSVAAQSATTMSSPQPENTLEPMPTREPTPQLSPQEIQALDDVYSGRLRGTIIARGTNATPIPVGRMSLLSYEVEEITLPITVTADMLVPTSDGNYLQPRVITFDKIWVFRVTGGPFLDAANIWTIWLDDHVIGYSGGGEDYIAALFFDRSLLHEGATIGVSYGEGKPYVHLPEKLHLDAISGAP